MNLPKTYFFRPRVGLDYEKGFRGYRTLVVGAYHYCWEAVAARFGCNCYDACVRKGLCREYDTLCPCYADKSDKEYYRLSNSNVIEIDAYVEGENCPAYNGFTKYMTGECNHIASEDRDAFWESVAFYNYLQYLLPESRKLGYKDDKQVFDRDFPSFAQVLEELAPEVVYVWTPAVKDAIEANRNRLSGGKLVFAGKADCQAMTVSKYIYYPDGQSLHDKTPRRKTLKWFQSYVRSIIGEKDQGNLPNMLYNECGRAFSVIDGIIAPTGIDKSGIYELVLRARNIPDPYRPSRTLFTWDELDRIFCIPNLKIKAARYQGRRK